MPEVAKQMKSVPKLRALPTGETVIQYWVCESVDQDRHGDHVYTYRKKLRFIVVAYCSSEKDAKSFCFAGRFVLEVKVFDYHKSLRLARKNNIKIVGVVLNLVAKAP